jgi:hypothetical protein
MAFMAGLSFYRFEFVFDFVLRPEQPVVESQARNSTPQAEKNKSLPLSRSCAPQKLGSKSLATTL